VAATPRSECHFLPTFFRFRCMQPGSPIPIHL